MSEINSINQQSWLTMKLIVSKNLLNYRFCQWGKKKKVIITSHTNLYSAIAKLYLFSLMVNEKMRRKLKNEKNRDVWVTCGYICLRESRWCPVGRMRLYHLCAHGVVVYSYCISARTGTRGDDNDEAKTLFYTRNCSLMLMQPQQRTTKNTWYPIQPTKRHFLFASQFIIYIYLSTHKQRENRIRDAAKSIRLYTILFLRYLISGSVNSEKKSNYYYYSN